MKNQQDEENQSEAGPSGSHAKQHSAGPFAERMQNIASFHVMSLLGRAQALAATGRDIIHLEVGEPDFPSPPRVIEAGIKALQEGRTHYTPATGIPELKRRIADFYLQRYGVTVAPERVIVTPGSSGALQALIALLINPDERVLLTDPGYPCNRHFVSMYGGKPVVLPVSAADGFQFTPASIRANWSADTKALLMASPSNPTGTVVDAPMLESIADTVADLNGSLLVDEIYHGLSYDIELPTVLQFSDSAFVINSFSKYFGMTGWRIGWLIAPEAAVPEIKKLCENMFLAPPTLAQYAALAAFEDETLLELERRRQEFKRRRDFLEPALKGLGLKLPCTSQGAFYIYADVSEFTDDSYQFCLDLLEQTGVAVTPGIDFGVVNAKKFIRIAYTTSVERLNEAVGRIGSFLCKV